MDFYDATEVIMNKLSRRAGFNIVDGQKGKVKFPSLQGEFVTFLTSDGFGFAPVDNPEDIHWTVHTKKRISKQTAILYLLLSFFEAPAEFHEKMKGKVTKKFRWRDGYTPFGKFIEERRRKHKK